MTTREAEERAAMLGMTAWTIQATVTNDDQQITTFKCIGFSTIGLPIGEGETWEEAFSRAAHVIFAA